MNNIRKTIHQGFTLVELLIVVIILAILAAIVVPQFSASTDDAKLAALDSNLSALRSSLNFYYQQHGAYPGGNTAQSGSDCNTAVTGPDADVDRVKLQLTRYTNADGEACAVQDTDYPFGPYLRDIPANPMTDSASLAITTDGRLDHTSSSTTGGWIYDLASGRVAADHSSYVTR